MLGVDEKKLAALSETLTQAGIEHRRIVESDAPYTGQLMALGLVPVRKAVARRYVSSLPLLR